MSIIWWRSTIRLNIKPGGGFWGSGRGEEPRPIAIALVLKGTITRLHPIALPIRSMAPRAVGTWRVMGMGPPGPLGPWGPLGVWE